MSSSQACCQRNASVTKYLESIVSSSTEQKSQRSIKTWSKNCWKKNKKIDQTLKKSWDINFSLDLDLYYTYLRSNAQQR